MNQLIRASILFSVATTVGCVDLEYGNGVSATERWEHDAFLAVQNDAFADVEIEVGDAFLVQATCDENLLPRLASFVDDDGTLVIEAEEDGKQPFTYNRCVVEIRMPALHRLASKGSGIVTAKGALTGLSDVEAAGSGPVRLSGVDAETLRMASTGSGGITASGTAAAVGITSSGSGEVDCSRLEASSVVVRASGSGGVQVHASDDAAITLEGSGGVIVNGGGHLTTDDTGSGEITVR